MKRIFIAEHNATLLVQNMVLHYLIGNTIVFKGIVNFVLLFKTEKEANNSLTEINHFIAAGDGKDLLMLRNCTMQF